MRWSARARARRLSDCGGLLGVFRCHGGDVVLSARDAADQLQQIRLSQSDRDWLLAEAPPSVDALFRLASQLTPDEARRLAALLSAPPEVTP